MPNQKRARNLPVSKRRPPREWKNDALAPRRFWYDAFLQSLALVGVVRDAAEAAGITAATAYAARAADPEFKKRWLDAVRDATDRLEAEARRRATVGVRDLVLYQGKPCYVYMLHTEDGTVREVPEGTEDAIPVPVSVTKYSDSLLLALLRANRAKFRRSSDGREPPAGSVPENFEEVAEGVATDGAAELGYGIEELSLLAAEILSRRESAVPADAGTGEPVPEPGPEVPAVDAERGTAGEGLSEPGG